MGFLKFLKRGKENAKELDLPPEPPPMEGFEKDDFPEFPEIKADDLDMPKFDMPDADMKDMHDYGKEMPAISMDMPDFPELEDEKNEPDAAPDPADSHQYSKPYEFQAAAPAQAVQATPLAEQKELPESESRQAPRPRLFHREKRALERPASKEIYVRVDRFKSALDFISMIRSDLRKSDEALMRLESIKNSKDMSFDRAKASIEDLQRKLVFIDKTLFRGDWK